MSSVYSNKLAYEVLNSLCSMCNMYKEVEWWNQTGKVNVKEGCISYTKYIGGELIVELYQDRTRRNRLFSKRYDTFDELTADTIYKDIYSVTGIQISKD